MSNKVKNCIERGASRAFCLYGRLIARHPLPFLLIPLIVTAALSCGFANFRPQDDEDTLYLASSSRALTEKAAHLEFYRTTSIPYTFDLMVRRLDGSSMLTTEDTNYALGLYSDILEKIEISCNDTKLVLNDICNLYNCTTFNESLSRFSRIFSLEKSLNSTSGTSQVRLSYPLTNVKFNGLNFNLMWIMSNVQLDANRTVLSASALRVFVLVQLEINKSIKHSLPASRCNATDALKAFGARFQAHFSGLKSDRYEFFVTYTDAVNIGIQAVSGVSLPLVALSIALLAIFTVSSSVTSSCIRSKPWEAAAGVANPCLGLASAIGLLSSTSGYTWNGMTSSVPFLVLAIGVDDMFMILSSWHLTNGRTVEERMGQLMSEAGLSVTITSLINVISFVTGVTQGIPAIEAFSAYSALALTFEYVYQLTFFAAIMVYGGRREMAGKTPWFCCSNKVECSRLEHVLSCSCLTPEEGPPEKIATSAVQKIPNFGDLAKFFSKFSASKRGENRNTLAPLWHERFFGNVLAPILNTAVARVFVLLFFIAYLVASLSGCCSMTSRFSVSKLVIEGSPPYNFYQFVENVGANDSVIAYFVVNRPPNFSNETETQIFDQMLDELERIETYSIGTKGSSEIWLRSMFESRRELEIEEPVSSYFLQWITSTEGRQFRFDINFERVHVNSTSPLEIVDDNPALFENHVSAHDEARIKSFTFRVFYQKVSFLNFIDRIVVMQRWRRICDEYPQFNVSVWNPWNGYVEQALIMNDNIMQDTAIAILAIGTVSALLMPNKICIFWVMYFLLVMEAGVIAFMKIFFDSDLDATFVATLAMVVGFSVDYLLHIACRFYHEQAESYKVRLHDSLVAIGWPIVQATISTFLGVCSLLFVHVQVIRVFSQTVSLVVLIGVIQGLLTLPVFLSALDEREAPNRARH